MTNALTWLRALLWVSYPHPSDYYGFCKLLPLSGDLLIDGVQYFLDFYVWKLKRPEDLGRATHPDHGRKDFPCVVMIVA
jgi:hypothetical protein